MNVLVTGGAGFIGSHVVRRWLARHPADEVVVLDRLTYAGSLERLAEFEREPRYRLIQGDIADPQAARQAMHGCARLIHLAAETHVDRSIADGLPFVRTNVEGTMTLLQEARRQGVERVIHISTDEVYGSVLEGAADEQAPLAPSSPYAASKAAGDLMALAFRATYGLPVVLVRPTNLFGPAQLPEKFIPLCITNALEERPVPIYGDGQQRRAWLSVEDFCDALDVIVERGETGRIYNVGSGSEQVNLDTAMRILRLLGRPPDLIQFVDDRPGHDRRYAVNDDSLKALGWRPRRTFDRGLEETVAWYRAHEAWWRPLVGRLREDPTHWLDRAAGKRPDGAALGVP